MIYAIMTISALLTILFSYITSDWYWIIIIPALAGLFMKSFKQSLLNGVLSGVIAWGIPALYMYATSAGIISTRVAEIFHFGEGFVMLLLTTLVAIIFAIVGSSTGYYAGNYLKEEFVARKVK